MTAKKRDKRKTEKTPANGEIASDDQKKDTRNGSPYLISKWASALDKLYEDPDSKRSPEEIWIAAMAHCSSIGEAMRKSDLLELMRFAARAFSWMLSFSIKCAKTKDILFRCNNNFCEMVYLKFPDLCGHCTESTCQCKPVDMDAEKDKAGKYRKLLEKWTRDLRAKGLEYTIEDWLGIFKSIYDGRIHLQTMETLGFHFLEEAGEEAMAIRKLMQLRGVLRNGTRIIAEEKLRKLVTIPAIAKEYIRLAEGQKDGKPRLNLTSRDEEDIYARIVDAKMDYIVELADTFSFFCSILIKLGSVKIGLDESFSANLEQSLINTYGKPDEGLICPVCKECACKCVFFPGSTSH